MRPMTEGKKSWKPDDDETLKTLVRETIRAAGVTDTEDLPHKIRERIRGQVTGEIDVDEIIKQVLKEANKNNK